MRGPPPPPGPCRNASSNFLVFKSAIRRELTGSRLGTEKTVRQDATDGGNQARSRHALRLSRVFSMAEISSFPPCRDTARKAAGTPSFAAEAAEGFFAIP